MITHDVLLSLSFTPLPNSYYQYKVIRGQLHPETGTLHLDGFGPPIVLISDLKFIMKMVDGREFGEI